MSNANVRNTYLDELIEWASEKDSLHDLSKKKSIQNMQCKRGQIYWAVLGKNVGSEQNERRPVIVVQNDMGNRFGPTTIVAPITDPDLDRPKPLPTEVKIHLEQENPDDASEPLVLVTGLVRAQQLRVISKARLEKMIVDLNDEETKEIHPTASQILSKVNRACKISLGLQ